MQRHTVELSYLWRFFLAFAFLLVSVSTLLFFPVVSAIVGLAALAMLIPERPFRPWVQAVGPGILVVGSVAGWIGWLTCEEHVASIPTASGVTAHVHVRTPPWWAWSPRDCRVHEAFLSFEPPIEFRRDRQPSDDLLHDFFATWPIAWWNVRDTAWSTSHRLYTEGQSDRRWESVRDVVWGDGKVTLRSEDDSVLEFLTR